MRDVVLLGGFVVCVVIGAVTVLWPELASHDETPQATPQNAPAAAVP
jgi:hypothetical protein